MEKVAAPERKVKEILQFFWKIRKIIPPGTLKDKRKTLELGGYLGIIAVTKLGTVAGHMVSGKYQLINISQQENYRLRISL